MPRVCQLSNLGNVCFALGYAPSCILSAPAVKLNNLVVTRRRPILSLEVAISQHNGIQSVGKRYNVHVYV